MLLYENRSPRAFFGPPFPPRKIFDSLEKTMGPYQGLFYQNKRLVLYSPTCKGLWKQIGHEKTLDDFLDHLSRHVTVGERSHLKEFLEKAKHLESQITDRFILVPNTMGEFLFLGIILTPTPFGTHLSLSPASDLKECAALQESIDGEKLPALFSELANWFEDAETEELITQAITTLPEELSLSIHIHRINSYIGVGKERQGAHLFYEDRAGKWVRNIFDSDEPSGYIPTTRLQAYMEGVDVMMRTPMFIGQVLPLFWISINHQKLNQFGVDRFSSYLRDFSRQSVMSAQQFQSSRFHFSKYWSGQGYSPDGLVPISRILENNSAEAQKIPVLPIWGLSQATLPGLQKSHRIPDPLFLDWDKGLAIIMLRNCSLEQASSVVWKNLKSRIKLPVDPPLPLSEFLKLE
ncbi:MAG: hypothetical protein ACYCXP_12745 [Leptospirillum sp.]|jgi:hypothetical protein